jgi:hypothetical protein
MRRFAPKSLDNPFAEREGPQGMGAMKREEIRHCERSAAIHTPFPPRRRPRESKRRREREVHRTDEKAGGLPRRCAPCHDDGGGYAPRSGQPALRLGRHALRWGRHALRLGRYTLRLGRYTLRLGRHASRSGRYTLRWGRYALRWGRYAPYSGRYASRQSAFTNPLSRKGFSLPSARTGLYCATIWS